jgi:ribonucleoside-diphosphate reductase alpha chain
MWQMAEAGKLRTFQKGASSGAIPADSGSPSDYIPSMAHLERYINLRALNNNTGTIHMSNLCTEICLPQDRENVAVCNLGIT